MHSPSGLGGEGGLKVLEKSLLGGGGRGVRNVYFGGGDHVILK